MSNDPDPIIDTSVLRRRTPISIEEQRATELALRRRFAGTRWDRPTGGDPTRCENGEWMQRFVVDMPEAMRAALDERAQACGITSDQIIREALVADGIGDASHVVGIQDGTARSED